jgi:tRNA threonylcarbamoyladenosine dehydratase
VGKKMMSKGSWASPQIFNLKKPSDRQAMRELKEQGKVWAVYDRIDLALSELYDIHHPDQKDHRDEQAYRDFVAAAGNLDEYGNWVFYPWSADLVHFPPKNDLLALRTSRNRNLITHDEQQTLSTKTVLIVGLSVGSNAAETLVTEAIGGNYILVDLDIVEPTNLNRIKAGYKEIGVHKVDVVAKKISELDPYVGQIHYHQGLDQGVLSEILHKHRPDVIIDEMDSLEMKLHLRVKAKEMGLPVVMATDDGENALLDIERYDLNPNAEIFHGLLPQSVIDKLQSGAMSRPEIGMAIGKYFVGSENIPLRMFESLVEVGKTLPSWPQLSGAATLSGVLIAYAVKKIMLEQPLNQGHHLFSVDAMLDPEIHTKAYKQAIQKFLS